MLKTSIYNFMDVPFGVVEGIKFDYNELMRQKREESFDQFEATSLYCPKCRTAVPVRKRLLLVLPEGDEFEYLCVYCSFSVGTKIEKNAPQPELIYKP